MASAALQAHRNDPCRLFSADFGLRPDRAALAAASCTMGAAFWPHRLRRRKGAIPINTEGTASCKVPRRCHLLPSIHLQDSFLTGFPMSTPAPHNSHPDDPALLRVDGAIAT